MICGFTRSFGLEDAFGERREWIKPIMFSGGVGTMESFMVNKVYPEQGKGNNSVVRIVLD